MWSKYEAWTFQIADFIGLNTQPNVNFFVILLGGKFIKNEASFIKVVRTMFRYKNL